MYTTAQETDWTQIAGWLATDTPCSWFGVGCRDGHVASLELAENQLAGEIPPELGDLAAQVKLCIDRWYAFVQPGGNPLTGKQFGILLTYGDTDVYTSGAINAIHTFESILGYMHNRIDALVYGSASDEGDIKADKVVMEQAFELGRKLSV